MQNIPMKVLSKKYYSGRRPTPAGLGVEWCHFQPHAYSFKLNGTFVSQTHLPYKFSWQHKTIVFHKDD